MFALQLHSLRNGLIAVTTSVVGIVTANITLADSFQGLPFVHGQSGAMGVSSNGTMIVGYTQTNQSIFSPYFEEGVVWTNGVMTPLTNLPDNGFIGYAKGISGDGSTILGQGFSDSLSAQYLLLRGGNLSTLGQLSTNDGVIPAGISFDGSIVVGQAFDASMNTEAFRWQNGIMTGLGFLPGGFINFSEATAVSADGNVVVGHGVSAASSSNQAFRWVADGMGGGIMTPLVIPQGENSTVALAVSADGQTVVGYGGTNGGNSASLMWKDGTVTNLGLPAGYTSTEAVAVSGDGSIVVGWNTFGTSNLNHQAYLWTQNTGMLPLQDYLIAHGATNVAGWNLYVPTAISADGRTVVGYGYNPQGQLQAWSATIPEPSTLALPLLVVLGLLFYPRRGRGLALGS
ncbi:MAG TPA: hypothetical protein VGG64_02040 [Pirellulales bacterium]|jgi:probable HAF family extracellular repeat protein